VSDSFIMSNVNNVPSLSGSSADNPSENWIKKQKALLTNIT